MSLGEYDNVTVSGTLNEVIVELASASAFKLMTLVPTFSTPLGVLAVAKNAIESICFAWKTTLCVSENEGGTVSVKLPSAVLPPDILLIVCVVSADTEALPVQPVVIYVASLVVLVRAIASVDWSS